MRGELFISVDAEYGTDPNLIPTVRCLVLKKIGEGSVLRLWVEGAERGLLLQKLRSFGFYEPTSVMVAYYAVAECSALLSLGLPLPSRIVDLYVEARRLYNPGKPREGFGLLSVCNEQGLGLPIESAEYKEKMRSLAIDGGPYDFDTKRALLDYCESDVELNCRLFPKLFGDNLGSSLLGEAEARGKYMASVAHMESFGIPLDTNTLNAFSRNWSGVKKGFLEIAEPYGVYDDTGSFIEKKFAEYVWAQNLGWPRTVTGKLALDSKTFKEMGRKYPFIRNLAEVRESLSSLRLGSLKIGKDGRNRVSFFPFGTKTSRNAPSTTQFIFGLSKWLRRLVMPPPGRSLAYVDWSHQEFGVAAALSGDRMLARAYHSGDPYMETAKLVGDVPLEATKETHPEKREAFKAVVLGIQYGMSEYTLAENHRWSIPKAQRLLQKHKDTYGAFWDWIGRLSGIAKMEGVINIGGGWEMRVDDSTRRRTLLNWPMQSTGAEIMRRASILAMDKGISVCAPVHDAFLIEDSAENISETISEMREVMRQASSEILKGFELRTDVEVIRAGERYDPSSGEELWDAAMKGAGLI